MGEHIIEGIEPENNKKLELQDTQQNSEEAAADFEKIQNSEDIVQSEQQNPLTISAKDITSSYAYFSFPLEETIPTAEFSFNLFNAPLSEIILDTLFSSVTYSYTHAELGQNAQTDITYSVIETHELSDMTSTNVIFLLSQAQIESSSPALRFQRIEAEPPYSDLDTLTNLGTLGNDTINGSGLSINIIDGLDGDDNLTGGTLADEIWGGDGDDTIIGNSGDDKLVGSLGNDLILGGNGDDLIWGGDGWDDIAGNNGDDFISGNAGNDILYGSTGSDTLYGGDGDDILYALESGDYKHDLSHANDLHGGNGNDLIYGSSGNDTLHGDDGNDVISSRSGASDSYEDYVMGLNPIVYYRLGESSGTTAIDKSGNQNAVYNGNVNHSSASFNAGLKDNSIRFDGSDEQVAIAADDARFDTTQGTVNAWFNVEDLDRNHTVFAKDGNGNIDGQFYVGVDTNGDIYGRLQQGGTDSHFAFDPTAAVGSKVQTGQWYMLTMTYGTGGTNFYLNGQLIGSDATLTQTNSDRAFMIGGQNSTAAAQDEFQGMIDEVSWLAGELDATGVSNLYSAGTGAILDIQNITELYGGDGNDTLTGGEGLDHLYGGDGQDTLYGGDDADTFFFENISAFNNVDMISDFDENEGDVLDISDILSGLNVNAGNISDYVDINLSGDDTYYDYIMALTPLVYYRLDESTGTVAQDSAGNLDGTYSGSPSLGTSGFSGGISNDAVTFDGSNDEMVEVIDSGLFDTTQGTVNAWFNVADTASQYVVFSKDGNGNIDGQFYVGVDTNGDIFGRLQQDGTDSHFAFDPTAAIGSKVQASQWYMLTMTYGSGGTDFYLNGQLIGSDTTLTRTDSDRGFMIGARNYTSTPDAEFNGDIDEVSWLAGELDATSISDLYNAGVSAVDNTGLPSGLYVDATGSGTFDASHHIADFSDTLKLSDELTMLNNGSLII